MPLNGNCSMYNVQVHHFSYTMLFPEKFKAPWHVISFKYEHNIWAKCNEYQSAIEMHVTNIFNFERIKNWVKIVQVSTLLSQQMSIFKIDKYWSWTGNISSEIERIIIIIKVGVERILMWLTSNKYSLCQTRWIHSPIYGNCTCKNPCNLISHVFHLMHKSNLNFNSPDNVQTHYMYASKWMSSLSDKAVSSASLRSTENGFKSVPCTMLRDHVWALSVQCRMLSIERNFDIILIFLLACLLFSFCVFFSISFQ